MSETPIYVIDASVFVSDAQPWEAFHHSSSQLLARIALEQCQVLTPMIMLAEVSASIARQTGNTDLAQQFVHLLQQLPHIELVDVDEILGKLSADLAAQQRVRGCDAVYVALAKMRNAVLITLDQEQRQRVPAGVVAHTPGEELIFLQNANH